MDYSEKYELASQARLHNVRCMKCRKEFQKMFRDTPKYCPQCVSDHPQIYAELDKNKQGI